MAASYKQPLSSVLKEAVVVRFDCILSAVFCSEEDRKQLKAGKHTARTCFHIQVVIEDFYWE